MNDEVQIKIISFNDMKMEILPITDDEKKLYLSNIKAEINGELRNDLGILIKYFDMNFIIPN